MVDKEHPGFDFKETRTAEGLFVECSGVTVSVPHPHSVMLPIVKLALVDTFATVRTLLEADYQANKGV